MSQVSLFVPGRLLKSYDGHIGYISKVDYTSQYPSVYIKWGRTDIDTVDFKYYIHELKEMNDITYYNFILSYYDLFSLCIDYEKPLTELEIYQKLVKISQIDSLILRI